MPDTNEAMMLTDEEKRKLWGELDTNKPIPIEVDDIAAASRAKCAAFYEPRIKALEECIAALKRHVVTDFHTDITGRPTSGFRVCHICEYTWQDGEREVHNEACPLRDQPKGE